MDGRKGLADIVEIFQPLLRKWEKDEDLVIVAAIEKAGCNVGDNYMSIITRTEIKGTHGNGTLYIKSFISKSFPKDPSLVDCARTAELFRNEVHVYKNILPLLGPFGPECICADSERIIMEDLSLKNFSIRERRSLLDFDHSKAVIKTLAEFHAKSLSIKLKNPDQFQALMNPLIEVAYPSDSNPSIGRTIELSLNRAILSLEKINSGKDNTKALEFLKGYVSKAYDSMNKLISSKGKYHVLAHGDVWINNILFARIPENNESLRVKLVDFQGARYASLATDFHYFVYSSSRSTVIEQSYDELVEFYFRSFTNALGEQKIPKEDYQFFTIDWLHAELCEYALYGLFSSFSLVHAVLATEVPLKINTSLSIHDASNIPITVEKIQRIECVMSHFMQTYM